MDPGRLVKIDLEKGIVDHQVIPDEVIRDFCGGRGLNMRLLSPHLLRPGDPLAPDNPIVFSPGLLCGLPSLGSRMSISSRSPETGHLGDSNMGGELGVEMKAAGIDALMVVGRSNSPVYILIQDDRVEIRDARHLWGNDPVETQKHIRSELQDERVRIATIGIAGENRVRFAGVRTGLKNMAGRTGMGAVMGSKKLKAVAVRGTRDIQPRDPRGYLAFYREVYDGILKSKWVKALGRWGTPLLMKNSNTLGFLSVRNNQSTTFGDKGDYLDAEHLDTYSKGMVACTSCHVHCRHRYYIDAGPYAGTLGEGPEYASIGSMGSKLGNEDLECAIFASELCNRLGLDTISTGSYIAWAMELYQRGIIDESLVGYPIPWGDQGAIIRLLRDIANREGFGDILAEGRLALEAIVPEGKKYLLQIKGLPIEMTDERAPKSFALGMATASRGACHMRSRPSLDVLGLPAPLLRDIYGGEVSPSYLDYEGKGRMVWWHERNNAFCDSLGVCRFISVFSSPNAPKAKEFARLIYHAFGRKYDPGELWDAGERVCTLERMILLGNGITRDDDTLPSRYFDEPIEDGPARGEVIEPARFQEMLQEYYYLHGWDIHGVPRESTLRRLGLSGVTWSSEQDPQAKNQT
ncbi:MAG: aldehyde ferredoxin oxidoreductase family protein [Deltaproteobacteria bacterium]|nr:aldehyde ferredoxin oxidoreductase family protein [Deltaproteobacteria bacterium]